MLLAMNVLASFWCLESISNGNQRRVNESWCSCSRQIEQSKEDEISYLPKKSEDGWFCPSITILSLWMDVKSNQRDKSRGRAWYTCFESSFNAVTYCSIAINTYLWQVLSRHIMLARVWSSSTRSCWFDDRLAKAATLDCKMESTYFPNWKWPAKISQSVSLISRWGNW